MSKGERYIAFILLILTCLPTLVSVILSAQSLWIRHEMLERLEQEKLHRIVLQEKQLNWIDEGSELIINGELFDVKEFSKVGETYEFWGIFDKEETALSNWLEKNKNPNTEDMALSKLFQQFLKLQYHTASSSPILIAHKMLFIGFTHLGFLLPPSPYIDSITPPPNRFFV